MNLRIELLASVVLLAPVCGMAQGENPIPPDATVRQIMNDFVRPAADVLWGATAVYVTEQGEDDRSPKNDEEWNTVDQSRVAMEQAIEALMTPGRKVDVADGAATSEEDLNPAQIEALISKEPDVWAAKLQALSQSMQHSRKAIEDQDVESLTEIGGEIDDACESCHQHFWYPES